MRYDKVVYFVKEGESVYDPQTGDYIEGIPTATPKHASVIDTSAEMLRLVYGSIKQGSLTIHLQNKYDQAFDYILVGEKKYKPDYERKLRVKHTFVVSEVM